MAAAKDSANGRPNDPPHPAETLAVSVPADEQDPESPAEVHDFLEERRRLTRYLTAIASNPAIPRQNGGPVVAAAARVHQELRRVRRDLVEARARLAAGGDGESSVNRDPQTGLISRTGLFEAIESELARAMRFNTNLSLVLMDVDKFRDINHEVGQRGGDHLLRRLAQLLKQLTRTVDVVARYGWDVFAVVLPNEGLAGALAASQRWRSAIVVADFGLPGLDVPISITSGIVNHPEDDVPTAEDMLRAAEAALLYAKASRDRTVTPFRDLPEGRGPPVERRSVENLAHRVEELVQRSRSHCLDSIYAMAQTIEIRDGYTGRHSQKVHRLAVQLARRLKMNPKQIEALGHAAMLHDIGKIGIPDSILGKPGTLTADQWQVVMKHPTVGCRILSQAAFLRPTIPAVRHHHEHFNGEGYPDGLAGDQIPRAARILNLADAYDAMTSHRVYRPAMTPDEAIAEVRRGRGTQFDPELVDVFGELWSNNLIETAGGETP